MYVSSFFLSSLLALSTPAIVNGETQGFVSLRGDATSNVFVSACSSGAITVEGNDGLKLGSIITQIDGNDTSNCDDECSFLFRKIISVDGDGTYGTTFATFLDIFPTEIYDAVLAGTSVESLFGCEEQEGYRRMLETDAPTNVVTQTLFICDVYPYLNTAAAVITVFSTFLPFLLPVIPFLIPTTLVISLIFAATNTCGVTWDNFFESVLGGLRRTVDDLDSENNGDRSLRENIPFHPPFDKWMTTSSSGECDYVDCNVGSNGNASTCFSKDLVTDDFNFDRMIDMDNVALTKNSDIIHAFGVQDYCYASNTFEKDTCDSIIYKSLVNECQGSMSSQTSSQLTSFPLALSDISNDCLSLSLLFYIGAKNFGDNMYSRKQEMQLKHSKEDDCNRLMTTQM